jgi:rSAM/selenodomain-associated transferase 2
MLPVEQSLELSIIVPVLNDAEYLTCLLENLGTQTGVAFEVIVSDGGSCAETGAARELSNLPFELRSIRALPGRGRQMNAGAALARGKLLLFLHADSLFPDPAALAGAVRSFRACLADSGTAVAARFALRFRRSRTTPSLAYFFYEAKARLNRADCIRGDQGFMLARSLYETLGGFDESLPFLEDLRLAAAIAEQGAWLLLPAEITTSARRFETEGLRERQVVNALIVNAHVTGWDDFFTALPGLYRCHAETGRLLLYPLLAGIRTLLACRPLRWRLGFWLATGRHVAANMWQAFFWLDARRAFLSGRLPAETGTRWTLLFQRRLEWLAHTLPVQLLAGVLVWTWYRALLLRGRCPTGTS